MKNLYSLTRIAALAAMLLAGMHNARAQYCTTGLYINGCTDDDYIESFRTTGGSTNINNYYTYCNNGTAAYTYYIGPGSIHTAAAGSTVNYRLINGDYYGEDYFLFVDWNADNDFTDAGELVSTGSVLASDSVISSFNIPAGTSPGTKRLRVRVVFDPQTMVTACSQEDYGEIEDYSLAVTGSPCSQPSASSVSTITSNSADLSWSAVSGATGYEWSVITSTTPPTSGTGVSGTTATAFPLLANTSYYFHVRAVCGAGNFSTWKTTSFITTAPPICNPPANLQVDSIGSDFARITWLPEPGTTGYEFAIGNGPTPPGSGIATTQLNASFASLTKATVYYAHVRSVCTGNTFSGWNTKQFFTMFPAGVNDIQGAHLNIFPNPASQLLSIESSAPVSKAQAQITDLAGKVILQAEIASQHAQIDISKLLPGIYFLKYSENESVSVHRIVKQ